MSTDNLKQQLQVLVEEETNTKKLEIVYRFLKDNEPIDNRPGDPNATVDDDEDLTEVLQRLKFHC